MKVTCANGHAKVNVGLVVGTPAAGATGDLLGPIALLNFQGGAYVAAGVFVLLTLAPSRAPRQDPAAAPTT